MCTPEWASGEDNRVDKTWPFLDNIYKEEALYLLCIQKVAIAAQCSMAIYQISKFIYT